MFERPPQPDGTTEPAFGQFGDLEVLGVPDPQPVPPVDQPA